MSELGKEIARRRTFDCSHPDAGKTTFNEKFLFVWWCNSSGWAIKAKKGVAVRHLISWRLKSNVAYLLQRLLEALITATKELIFWIPQATKTLAKDNIGP